VGNNRFSRFLKLAHFFFKGQTMDICKKALLPLFLAIFVFSAMAAETITGRAVNSGSSPLTGVRVALTQMKVSDTTGTDGLFSLQIASSVLSAEMHTIVPFFSIQNNRIEFTLSDAQNVVISLFDASGRKAATAVDRSLTKGNYSFSLPGLGMGLASGLYVLGVSIQGTVAYARVVVAGGKIMSATRVDFMNGPMEMAKRSVALAGPDTIALSKSGYFITRKQLLSLATQNVGDVILNLDKIAVNNASQDLYDQFIVEAIANNGLDSSIAMILKSMIVIESGFNVRAISMYDTQLPCGTHSYGLIQVTPGCFPQYAAAPAGTPVTATITGGLNGVRPVLTYTNKADSIAGNTILNEAGHLINIVTNPANPLYANSAFNPAYNLGYGAKALAGFIADVKSRFKTCTNVEYVKMGLAAYNRGGNAVTGCGIYNAQAQAYVTSLLSRYRTFCTAAGITPVYQ
jgi:hypothetical protein